MFRVRADAWWEVSLLEETQDGFIDNRVQLQKRLHGRSADPVLIGACGELDAIGLAAQ